MLIIYFKFHHEFHKGLGFLIQKEDILQVVQINIRLIIN